MKLTISKSKNATLYYVQKSYRTNEGKSSTRTVERLGTEEEVIARFGKENTLEKIKEYVRELSREDKESNRDVTIKLSQNKLIHNGEQHCFNGGYLFLQKVYHELGLDRICAKIEKKHRNQYDLNAILSMLLYTRVIYPGSKRSSLEDAKRFIEQPEVDIHQVYRALSLLAGESDTIQADVYKRSLKLGKRNTKAIYYDCTNYYFETEEESGLRQYGHSKENRPNPIVQVGLFTDEDGMPLAISIDPGNTAETVTLKPLEEKLRNNFGFTKMITCTDGGLASYDNRINDSTAERSFITVQSLKKLDGKLQDWATETAGWRMIVSRDGHDTLSDEVYDLAELAADKQRYKECRFCKERPVKLGKEKGKELEQRLIVTFSFKYKDYLEHLRDRQLQRAGKMIEEGRAVKTRKSQNDPRKYIKVEHCTEDGEIAGLSSAALDQEMIGQEARFDGFYGICTDLADDAPTIIRINGGRYIIESCFRITKTEFEARPVFVRRDDRIKAHFLTCFLALLLYKYLEKKVNTAGRHFTTSDIISALRDMNFTAVPGEGYIPSYTRTEMTNCLHGSAGFRTDTQIVSAQTMKKIIAYTKKSSKQAQDDKM